MNRQLYAEGGIKSLMDIIASNPEKFADILNILEDVPREVIGGPYLNSPRREMKRPKRKLKLPLPTEEDLFRNKETRSETDLEVMERLMELQKRPEYQYDEKNMYEGPRDMRMDGGIMSVPIKNNRVHAFGGFGGFVGDIFGGAADVVGDIVGGAADVVGDVVGGAKDILDPVAQIASFIPGPHQPFAAAYTAGRGAGIGGSDFGGLQIGGFTPSGGIGGFGGGASTSPFNVPFAPQAPVPTSDFGKIANILQTGSSFMDYGKGPGKIGKPGTSSTGNILGTLLNVGLSAYGAKKSYDQQKEMNRLRQQEYEEKRKRYDEFMAEKARKRRQYYGEEPLEGMTVSNRQLSKEDIIGRRGAGFGGMISNLIAQNPGMFARVSGAPQLQPSAGGIGGAIGTLLQRQGIVSPVSSSDSSMTAPLDVRNRSQSYGDFLDENGNGVDDREEMYLRGTMKQGGMTDLNIRTNPQGVKEIDYREEGGFVPPIGIKEKADDIPAMLSNNEFVFTADAVRGAGNGSVNKGAKRMYTLMKKLEAGGKV